ncbi:uncharacterized protein LOC135812005 [Sycon ciliatum]|uniref:uncharacterized protein LOC135812005 n=1 Tax=Sycon ciliatum TaxID=27933 RepID=UPI0031F70F55|eukprot:scpid69555/ scgid25589/ 
MSIDLGFFETSAEKSPYRRLPLKRGDREAEDRMKIEYRVKGVCAREYEDWYWCNASGSYKSKYACYGKTKALLYCQKRAEELLLGKYEEMMKLKGINAKEAEIEQRLDLARAEREAQAAHIEQLRQTARRELDSKRAAEKST